MLPRCKMKRVPKVGCCADLVRKSGSQQGKKQSQHLNSGLILNPQILPLRDYLVFPSKLYLSITFFSIKLALLFFKENMFLIKIKTLRQVMK